MHRFMTSTREVLTTATASKRFYGSKKTPTMIKKAPPTTTPRPRLTLFGEPASKHPNLWIMLCKSWRLLVDYIRQAEYRNPDAFDMNIYNDFHC